MANEGSSTAAAEIVNTLERLELIREGQVKEFVYNGVTWVRKPLVPYPPLPLTAIAHGVLTVAGGSIVPFPAQPCNTVVLKASRDNIGVIYIGSPTVSDLNGYELEPSEAISLNISNVNLLSAVAEVAGEKVKWLVVA
jgi:hypothetical protein